MTDNDDFETGALHPDEAMAAYVDGSATAEERRGVETHVATCARCRREVELAAAARTALASLPELDWPPLRVPGAGTEQDSGAGSVVPLGGRERRGTWQRAAWGLAGVGAAAAVIVALVILGGNLGSHTSATSSLSGGIGAPAPIAPTTATRAPQFEQTGTDYSPTGLHALAVQSASTRGSLTPAPLASPGESAAGGKDSVTSLMVLRVACVAQAAGAAPADVVRVEAARFQGERALIGTLLVGGSGSPTGVLVVATRPALTSPCAPLYETTARIPTP